MKRHQMLLAGLVLVFTAMGQAFAAGVDFKEGTDYEVLKTPVTVDTDKPFLVEYLWLGCPHCQALNPYMLQYEKDHPNVEIVRKPGIGPKRWVLDAHIFFALYETGNGKLFAPLMDFYHNLETKERRLPDQNDINGFLKSHNIDQKSFNEAMTSFETMNNLQRTLKEEQSINLTAVPTVVVAGKYKLLAPAEGEGDAIKRYFELIDYLLKKG